MSDEWGPWIAYDGHGCPCVGDFGHVEYNNGEYWPPCIIQGNPQAWDFDFEPEKWAKVIRYRVRKPRGLTMLEEIARNVPANPKVTA